MVVIISQDPYHGEEAETQMMWSWSHLKILWHGEDSLSHVMRKPVFAICVQQRRRSACASAQSDQRLCYSLPRKYNTSSFFISDISRDQGQEEGKKYMYSKVRRPKVVSLVHSSVRPIVTLEVIFENSFVEARRIILKVSTIQRSNVVMRKPSKIALFMEEG